MDFHRLYIEDVCRQCILFNAQQGGNLSRSKKKSVQFIRKWQLILFYDVNKHIPDESVTGFMFYLL